MRAARIILKILILFLTSTWGLIFGIFSPLLMMNYDVVDYSLSEHPVFILWLIMGISGYIVPCVFVMLKLYKLSCVFSVSGTIMVFVIHSTFLNMKAGNVETSPSFMYLPQILMTILVIIFAVMENFKQIMEIFSRREEKLNAKAPSILGENVNIKEKNTESNKSNKNNKSNRKIK